MDTVETLLTFKAFRSTELKNSFVERREGPWIFPASKGVISSEY